MVAINKKNVAKTWRAVLGHWKISGGALLVIIVAVVGAILINAKNNKGTNEPVANLPQNQLKQQFLDQLPGLQKQAQSDPNNPAIQQQLGVTKYATGDLQGALQAYEKGVQLDSNNAVLHNNLGNTYRDLGDYTNAENQYRLAMQLDPKSTTAYMNLGTIYQYILRKPNTALQIYAEGIKNNPDFVDFYNVTAAIYEQQGLKSKAVAEYRQVLKVQPGNPAAAAGLKSLQ